MTVGCVTGVVELRASQVSCSIALREESLHQGSIVEKTYNHEASAVLRPLELQPTLILSQQQTDTQLQLRESDIKGYVGLVCDAFSENTGFVYQFPFILE